uniref:Non-specific protein-tyrosine kinase n=1 Tax=Rhabditophanes sp. KR3021 TaxID=114890 RepID=A0AC35U523_9BILA
MNIKPSNALDKIKPAKFRIRPNRIIIKEKNNLGNGHYSTIYEGSYNTDNKQTWIKVACKVMNSKEEKSLQDQIMEVHRDIEVLKNLVHINIVKFYGVTFNQTNDYGYVFIIEFSDVGDMEKYFINARNRILVKEAKQWIMEVINGLTFLHKNNTIHRDLSAKNVLLFKEGSRKIAKLTDFGLSRRLNQDQYYHASSKTEVPINRITLNAMQTLKFSVYDDIWALGTLIYELFHINRIMYSDIANDDNYVENFRKHLKEGNRLIFTYERKNENYDKLFSIAESCWHDNRSERPTLSEILDRLKALNFGDDILEHLSQ